LSRVSQFHASAWPPPAATVRPPHNSCRDQGQSRPLVGHVPQAAMRLEQGRMGTITDGRCDRDCEEMRNEMVISLSAGNCQSASAHPHQGHSFADGLLFAQRNPPGRSGEASTHHRQCITRRRTAARCWRTTSSSTPVHLVDILREMDRGVRNPPHHRTSRSTRPQTWADYSSGRGNGLPRAPVRSAMQSA
jgi:hypothetical protein